MYFELAYNFRYYSGNRQLIRRQIEHRFGDLEVATRQVPGDPATTICEVAEDEGADVIVVGNRGLHGRRRWLIGSVPQVVLQHAPCSVMVVDTRAAQ